MYNDIDTNNEQKIIKEGNIKYDRFLKENADSFELNEIFADNMVLQRNAVNCIWGRCFREGEIAVVINKQTFYGTVKNGAFKIYISPMEAGGPYDMIIFNDMEKVTVKNVMIGEVFLLAGQSNMLMRVEETQPTEESQSYCNDYIRLFEIEADYEKKPLENLNRSKVITWACASEKTVPHYSAVGYYFALELQRRYPDMPVGLVMCCQGETNLCTWIPQYAYDELESEGNSIPVGTEDPRFVPALHYNAMVGPIKNFKFKTVLWYQGEGQRPNYDKGLEKLILVWRKEFDSPDMGFVIFTLPRLVVNKYGNYAVMSEADWFSIREQQMHVAQTVDNATYCVANDLGSYDDIHPLDKKVIATRAAHAFISKFYNSTETLTGPRYESYEVKENSIEITYTNVGSGLELRNKGLGFEIMNRNHE